MTLTHGVGVGWLAPSLPLLGSEETPLGTSISIDEASWVGSLIGLGALTGNIIFGLLLDRLGRKMCMYLLAIPNMVDIMPSFESVFPITQIFDNVDLLDSYLFGSRRDVPICWTISSRRFGWRLLCGITHICSRNI